MKRLVLLVSALALLAACTSTHKPPASEAFNDTDVMFLQMMIAHHAPAEQMLNLAKTRAKREDVKTLAAAVAVTQADESKSMTQRLEGWGKPLVSTAGADAHAHHGGVPQGIGEMAALKRATDADFDKVFLNIFAGYQQSAVTLAQMEIRGGSHVQTLELADRVDKNRRAQIELMSKYVNGAGAHQ